MCGRTEDQVQSVDAPKVRQHEFEFFSAPLSPIFNYNSSLAKQKPLREIFASFLLVVPTSEHEIGITDPGPLVEIVSYFVCTYKLYD